MREVHRHRTHSSSVLDSTQQMICKGSSPLGKDRIG